MNEVFIGVGTNLGDRLVNIQNAYTAIENEIGKIMARSGFYQTPPWGYDSGQEFLNTVVKVQSEFGVQELLQRLKTIETEMGRAEKAHSEGYTDRIIDLDIIDFNGAHFQSDKLTVPHERMHLRTFVLIPLAEIAPDWVHPVSGKAINDLISSCLDGGQIRRLF